MEYYDIIDDSGCRTARSLSSVPEIGGGDENCNCSDGSHQDGDGSTITAGTRIDDTSSSIFPPNYDESRVSGSNHNHQYNNNNDDNRRTKSSRRRRIYHWWTDILSRVSRSASSLLNQHTPKLDDILDTGDHENSQLADVSQLQSQQRQHDPLDEVQSSNSSANSISRRGGNSRLLRPDREESNTGRNNGNSDTNCNDDDEKNETIIALQEEIALLKQRIHTLECKRDEELWHGGENVPAASLTKSSAYKSDSIDDIRYPLKSVLSLAPDQITRYSRQLLLNDGFGIVGQCKLLSSSILVIGAGGIGSTVLLYLAAVGVGHITVVDYDTIEMSNLHRQIIHKDVNATSKKKKSNTTTTTTTNKGYKVASDEEMRRGMLNNKAISAKYAMLELNPTLSCTALTIAITATNALDLISKHDVIVDASDNPQTRYIINDACILANKPLVSGSAMGTEGQLTVYNYQPTATATANAGSDNVTPTSSAENNNDNGGGRGISCSTKQQEQRTACYRCLYPKSTTTDGCKSCSDNGVLGMIPGVIGILQAVEVIKILTDIGHVMHDQLVMYDSLHGTFINIKKPPPRINCAICSIAATITTMEESEQSLLSVRGPSVSSSSTTLIPSTTTCPLGDSGEGGGTANVQSISCIEYNNNVRNIGQPHILLDVRVPRQYEMCSLDGSINLPLEELESQLDTMIGGLSHGQVPIYCLCRRGIASTTASRIIQKSINDGNAAIHSVYNIAGGLQSWVDTVDSDFPEY